MRNHEFFVCLFVVVVLFVRLFCLFLILTIFFFSIYDGSHTPSSKALSPFLEGECCYERSLSWLKIDPHDYAAHKPHFNIALVFLLVSVCCDTAKVKVAYITSLSCRHT